MTLATKYAIITPVRDEEEYIQKTILSVVEQTITPIEWVIVNDGSIDSTGQIIDDISSQYSWIRALHRKNRGFRKAGGGVVEAFNEGYKKLGRKDFEYIVKLDGDLSFDPAYFQSCFEQFNNDAMLGIGGGVIYNIVNGGLQLEKNPIFHVRGATKIYKKDCWDSLGGLLMAPGWDTLDEVKANMLGWQSRSFPEIHVAHHRYTGAADGTWKNLIKNGKANYISGYHPVFMFAKCIKRLYMKPYFVGSLALICGFIQGYLKNIPQVDDKALISYLRKQQLRKLLFRESIWN